MTHDAAVIADAEREIRLTLKQAVWDEWDNERIKREVASIIRKRLAEIRLDTIRQEAAVSLPRFASRVLNEIRNLRALLQGLGAALMATRARDRLERWKHDRERYDAALIEAARDPAAYNIEQGSRLFFREYHRKVKEAFANIISTGADAAYGDHVNLKNIAEMTVRYDNQLRMIDNLRERGDDLVWIEPHANCSERCQPWQEWRGVYSISGRRGMVDGIPIRPLSDATEARQGRWINGCITGYGCRHKLIPYRGPQSRPAEIPAEVVEKQRAIEKKMRALERAIRTEKEKAAFYKGLMPDAAKKARKKAKLLNRRYEALARGNNIQYVPERTRVFAGENRFKPTNP